jgi:hypothetical protein
MEMILGGYLETALIHYADEIVRPDFNRGGHPYYMCVNRQVPKAFFDRASTLVAISSKTIVPSIDWTLPEAGTGLNAKELDLDINGLSCCRFG